MTDMTTTQKPRFTELIERLEAAEGPSEELDAEIWRLKARAGLQPMVHQIYSGYPKYTKSTDAALTLVPEGWVGQVEVGDAGHLEGKRAELWNGEFAPNGIEVRGQSKSKNSALALCIAALRARQK